MKAADDGSALDDGVAGQVFEGEQRASFAEIGDQFMGHLAAVKIIRMGGDAAKGAGQLGLTEGFTFLVELPISLEDALGVGEESQVRVAEFTGLFGGELKALGG